MRLLLISLFFLTTTATAQELPDFKVPANYSKIWEVKGDLDKDGIAEVVYAYNTNKPDGASGFFRILYICKLFNGKAKLWKQNSSVLRSSKDCGFCLNKGIDLSINIKNNTLIIQQNFQHNARHYSSNKNIFRYQNGDWFLIGSTYNVYDTCEFDDTYDINFSTKQVSVACTYGDCDEGKTAASDEFFDFKYPFKAIPKMDGFKPGKVELRIPKSRRFFYY
ncbi:hypothetical protein LPB86_20395 [Pedobacter sp. MC2016-14]|uniref:hypothetical protein n=1 Tax=Pedobacter sp. MC2016-14 TaxID=2897327 RepID=UPI001E64A4AA|nr:hypothetical protein [Pedobacter sp. MC2016-14]MCD0490609.1 hypothetical protein [Pedobacter sp. MC2016-14]